jgi:hypothetical protein
MDDMKVVIFFIRLALSGNILKIYFTLREEHRMRMFENRVLEKIFEPENEELILGRRKLHDLEYRNLYPSPNIVRMFKPGTIR